MNNFTTNPFDDDHFHEECGVFGIFNHKDSAAHTALGLHALQHRGQEAAGIVSTDGQYFNTHRALGLVGDIFSSQDVMNRLLGSSAIGHNRYSTAGETVLRNVQPIFAEFEFGGLAIGHNGNLTNAFSIKKRLVDRGCIFQSTMDTEIIVHLIAISQFSKVVDRMIDALRHIQGAYSIVALTKDALIGVRDPLGVRPLVLGIIDGAYIMTSETCALDIIGADFIRDIEPGEIVIIDKDGISSIKPFTIEPKKFCIFEYIYFARPDSSVEGNNVYEVRKKIGAELARESSIEADIVVPVPDSGVPAAIGYAEQSKIPFELGIIRNHYVGRTFIEPTDQIRHLGVKLKHNANKGHIEGKRVILVDDSIVRGTTSEKIVEMVRAAGAKEVHMRISSPPTTNSCYYGIDTPESDQLLASKLNIEAMAKHIGADSLSFISINGLYRAVGGETRIDEAPQYCDACFSGEYPIELTDRNGATPTAQLSLLSEQERE
jgi:amidophosphoribosyltransferase